MRIQHNIMAMNSYRNYTSNTSSLAKNLEKLSSGYKINRAGDDAAGLAISEKMRAQITGLQAASKNVKDGVSLVKTAEGALQEVHDMLNRMDYLATQSANGTCYRRKKCRIFKSRLYYEHAAAESRRYAEKLHNTRLFLQKQRRKQNGEKRRQLVKHISVGQIELPQGIEIA